MAEIQMSVYDYNKQLLNNEEPISAENLKKALNQIVQRMVRLHKLKRNYMMLLCHDRRDFSVFCLGDDILNKSENEISADVVDVLLNRGTILRIDELKDGNFEIWIRGMLDEENYCYYLFDYSDAVIDI